MAKSATAYGAVEGFSVGIGDGSVLWLEPDEAIPEFDADVDVIDGQQRWLTPGLIDCHTHLVYGGNRAKEWEMRLGGVPYEEIARQGGGILSSVMATRLASEDELVATAVGRLNSLMAEGVTTVEIKSGYGLDLETELKMPRAAKRVANPATSCRRDVAGRPRRSA